MKMPVNALNKDVLKQGFEADLLETVVFIVGSESKNGFSACTERNK